MTDAGPKEYTTRLGAQLRAGETLFGGGPGQSVAIVEAHVLEDGDAPFGDDDRIYGVVVKHVPALGASVTDEIRNQRAREIEAYVRIEKLRATGRGSFLMRRIDEIVEPWGLVLERVTRNAWQHMEEIVQNRDVVGDFVGVVLVSGYYGLVELNDVGVSSRDLHPANIFVPIPVEVPPYVLLGDFGHSWIKDSAPGHISTNGETHGFELVQPPEVLRGRNHSGYLDDLFTLGASAHILASAHRSDSGELRAFTPWKYVDKDPVGPARFVEYTNGGEAILDVRDGRAELAVVQNVLPGFELSDLQGLIIARLLDPDERRRHDYARVGLEADIETLRDQLRGRLGKHMFISLSAVPAALNTAESPVIGAPGRFGAPRFGTGAAPAGGEMYAGREARRAADDPRGTPQKEKLHGPEQSLHASVGAPNGSGPRFAAPPLPSASASVLAQPSHMRLSVVVPALLLFIVTTVPGGLIWGYGSEYLLWPTVLGELALSVLLLAAAATLTYVGTRTTGTRSFSTGQAAKASIIVGVCAAVALLVPPYLASGLTWAVAKWMPDQSGLPSTWEPSQWGGYFLMVLGVYAGLWRLSSAVVNRDMRWTQAWAYVLAIGVVLVIFGSYSAPVRTDTVVACGASALSLTSTTKRFCVMNPGVWTDLLAPELRAAFTGDPVRAATSWPAPDLGPTTVATASLAAARSDVDPCASVYVVGQRENGAGVPGILPLVDGEGVTVGSAKRLKDAGVVGDSWRQWDYDSYRNASLVTGVTAYEAITRKGLTTSAGVGATAVAAYLFERSCPADRIDMIEKSAVALLESVQILDVPEADLHELQVADDTLTSFGAFSADAIYVPVPDAWVVVGMSEEELRADGGLAGTRIQRNEQQITLRLTTLLPSFVPVIGYPSFGDGWVSTVFEGSTHWLYPFDVNGKRSIATVTVGADASDLTLAAAETVRNGVRIAATR